MKRVLLIVGVVLLLLIVPPAVAIGSAFIGIAELQDGVDLPGGARLVKDGYVAINVLPTGEKEVALIDCGNDEKGAAVLAELKRRGLEPDAVKAIFLTHGHPDHIAGCHLFPHAQVMALVADRPVAEGTGRAKGPLPSLMDTPKEKRTQVTRPLTDGEVVTVGALNVKVYALPGHTAGSAAYLANEVLYFGDSATSTTGGKLVGAPWVFSDDTAQNKLSLEALAKKLDAEQASVKKLAFAHSAPLEGLAPLKAFKAE